MWFCVDSCGTVETFQTEAEAKRAAEDALQSERADAIDGWSDEVEHIMWGKVYGSVVQSYCRPRTDEDFFVSSDCDEVCDYELRSVE